MVLAHSHSIHVQRWIKYFIDHQWNVHVISFHPEKISGAYNYYLNVGSINHEGKNNKYLLMIPKIFRLKRQINPDVIISHYLVSFGYLGMLISRGQQILSLYGTDVFDFSNKNILYKRLTYITLNRAYHIFSVSNTMTSFIENNFRLEKKKITTIQYGIDTNLFKIKSNIKDRKYDFITNRSFNNNSNYPVIIEAFSRLRDKFTQASLLIVGSGVLKEEIKGLIKMYNLDTSVDLIDSVSQDNLAELLNSARIYLSFTSSDGTSLSLFEALSCGLFPILSDIPANLEWKSKGLNAEWISIKNVNQIVLTFCDVYDRIEGFDYLKNNLELVNRYMDYNKNMAQIEKKIISCLK